jgi:hypothetical protein
MVGRIQGAGLAKSRGLGSADAAKGRFFMLHPLLGLMGIHLLPDIFCPSLGGRDMRVCAGSGAGTWPVPLLGGVMEARSMRGRTEVSSVPSGRGLEGHRLLGWGPVVPAGCATFTTGYVPGSRWEHWGGVDGWAAGWENGLPRGCRKQQAGRPRSMLRTGSGDLSKAPGDWRSPGRFAAS